MVLGSGSPDRTGGPAGPGRSLCVTAPRQLLRPASLPRRPLTSPFPVPEGTSPERPGTWPWPPPSPLQSSPPLPLPMGVGRGAASKGDLFSSVLEAGVTSFPLFSSFSFAVNDSVGSSVRLCSELCRAAVRPRSDGAGDLTGLHPSDCAGARDLGAEALQEGALPTPAQQHHLGDQLEMHLLRPHPRPTKPETPGRGPGSGF